MTHITTEVTIDLDYLKDAVADAGLLIGDEDSVARQLREAGYSVYDEYEGLQDILDDKCDFNETLDWCRNDQSDEEILEYLDPKAIAEYARGNDLVKPDLKDIHPQELIAALKDHWDTQAQKVAEYRDLSNTRQSRVHELEELCQQHIRQRDDAMAERDAFRQRLEYAGLLGTTEVTDADYPQVEEV